MVKSQKKLLFGSLSTALAVPFIGKGLKVAWAAGAISRQDAISSLTGTIVNIIGGGQAANVRNVVVFVLGKAGNYSNWWDLAWSIIDLVTVFAPGGMAVRLAVSAGKLVATL